MSHPLSSRFQVGPRRLGGLFVRAKGDALFFVLFVVLINNRHLVYLLRTRCTIYPLLLLCFECKRAREHPSAVSGVRRHLGPKWPVDRLACKLAPLSAAWSHGITHTYAYKQDYSPTNIDSTIELFLDKYVGARTGSSSRRENVRAYAYRSGGGGVTAATPLLLLSHRLLYDTWYMIPCDTRVILLFLVR